MKRKVKNVVKRNGKIHVKKQEASEKGSETENDDASEDACE